MLFKQFQIGNVSHRPQNAHNDQDGLICYMFVAFNADFAFKNDNTTMAI